ncbi:MAG: N-acetyl-gamma-glutamyl-phosphate reductase, partial [Eubacteriales bacterium]
MYRVFIDGSAGTTGLKIFQRFTQRNDIELLQIDEAKRKDVSERVRMIEMADISFLCLPDAASKEICALVSPTAKILDTSTAHRTSPDWVYGFPELSAEQRSKVETATRVAVPGCHASGFIATVLPLVEAGILPKDYPLSAHSVTGYSGGGKQMIASYDDENRDLGYNSPRQYGFTQQHKHLPEMVNMTGIENAPVFNPIVADYMAGMVVTVPLHTKFLAKKVTPQDVADVLKKHYANQRFIHVMEANVTPDDGMLCSNKLAETNDMELYVYGNDDRICIAARY